MRTALLSAWPLFFGLAMIMVGNGLQGTLLGIRASMEGFSTLTTGIIMSLYYIGFLVGSYYVPKLIINVGHIRVFAALASLASSTVLFHGLFTDPIIWGGVRILTGFAYAGLFISIESWLNQASTNKTRGKIMALYLIVCYAGMTLGQFLLNVADPKQMELFVMTSVLVSIAILPISLSSRPAPAFSQPETISFKAIYKGSPLGIYGIFTSGLSASALFTIGAVYAADIGLSLAQISTFMACFIFGGVLFQAPIGWLSDRYDRRKVLIAVCALTSLFCFGAFMVAGQSFFLLSVIMLLIGGTALSIYALSIAHTNDHLQPNQIVAASATMILLSGAASCIGPMLVTGLMSWFGTSAFFVYLTVIYFMMAAFGIYRTRIRPPVPMDDQSDYVPVGMRSSPIVMQIAEEDSGEISKPADKTA